MRLIEIIKDIRDLILATFYNVSLQYKSLLCMLIFVVIISMTISGNTAIMPGINELNSTEAPPQTAVVSQDTTPREVQTTTYTVQSGDTLWNIALSYKTTVDQLVALNNLSGENLSIGQQLIIASTKASPSTAVIESVAPNEVQTTIYTVKSGDTLWDIAIACKTSVNQLIALNNLSGEKLSIGQQLIVSGTAAPSQNSPMQVASRSSQAKQTRSNPPSSNQTSSVVKKASQYLNTPYVWGGQSPDGFDCSGFVKYVFGQCGYKLPRTAAEQATVGTKVDRKNLAPGDIVYFATGGGGIDHVGIYVGNNKFIHSSSPRSGGVIYTSLSDSFYANSYAGARRISR